LKIRVLGCFGGSAPGMHPTSFLVNERIALDAGSLTPTLSLEEQGRITHVFLSHAHMDHLCTLPFLLDNVLPYMRAPIVLLGPPSTVQSLKQHVFNGVLWPDFTQISNDRTSVLRLHPLAPGETVEVHGVSWTPYAMEHEVECYGYLLEEAQASVFVCGDTSSLGFLEPVVAHARNLRAVFLEASFPRAGAEVARRSMHLSTESFGREVRDHVPPGVQVLVSHVKPGYAGRIAGEIERLGLPDVSLLEQGREYRF